MNKYRNQQAASAGSYLNIQAIVEEAVRTRSTSFGWVGSQFYQAYPSGRTVNYTETVPPRTKEVNAPVHGVWCSCPLCRDWVERNGNQQTDGGQQ